MKKYLIYTILAGLVALCSCTASSNGNQQASLTDSLQSELSGYIAGVDGTIGVAIITPDSDTILINNEKKYPPMSVFKLHQALTVADKLSRSGTPFDTMMSIRRSDMDYTTWSPMLKEHTEPMFSIELSELLRYILQQSDNNASNFLFDNIASVHTTDSLVRHLTGRQDFNLSYTEHQMKQNHELSRDNWSSPLACAVLINKVFTDSLIPAEGQRLVQELLLGCTTGQDRIVAAFKDMPGIKVGHKTGSGYRDSNDRLMAHNDIAHIMLPDGRAYSLAVLVTDFAGNEAQASAVIAEISRIVYDRIITN